ncbi:AAA ATPase domain-containing protein [Bryocella elongata]|uniref:AAA ATPase domain-containing protein n=1 Tax=Bryocella elongata TaxID=863522 RepID=A0A1H6BQJ7_9BACT|nr:AAA family ATPase [Bryocella elongata]SEG62964.1 AAA ATPase domain-containing protein [Bryocella elongata]
MPRSIALTAVTLRNFRAFESATLRLSPITILVGPNNAGKSSIISALRVLSNTLSSVDPDTSLLLEELGTYKDAVYRHETKRSIGFNLEFELDGKISSIDLNYGYRVQRREVVLQQFVASEFRDGQPEPVLRTAFTVSTGHQLIRELKGLPEAAKAKMPLPFVHFMPRLGTLILDRLYRKLGPQTREEAAATNQLGLFSKPYSELNRAFVRLNRFLVSLQYLGPFRESPARLYPFTGERPSVLGETGSGATDVLMSDFFRRGNKKGILTNKVKNWLRGAQIAGDLAVEALGDRHYQVQLKHPITGESSNIADVGFGASQVLPILVAGYDISEDSLLMVEQPEIHLHPRAQAELGEFFADVYKRGIQTILETHSEHLIMRLQTKVALGEIPKEDITVHYVEPTPDGKRIVTLSMDDRGIFQQKWPNGFFEERLTEAVNLARAPLMRGGGN